MARTERVEFTGSQGDRLAARMEWPAGTPRAYAVFAHCFSCSKDIFAANRIARQLAAHGYAVLRFDFTGLGHSEGDFANTNFSSNVEDLLAAARFVESEYAPPDLLIGHSLGGAAVIAAASALPGIRAVATLGAPSDAAHVAHQFGDSIDKIEDEGIAEVSLGGRPFTIKRQFLEDIQGHTLEDTLANLRKPLLIAHSPTDATVGIDNASRLFLAAKHPKSFVSLDGADHLLTREEDAVFAADIIASWAQKYVDAPRRRPAPKAKPGVVIVSETGAGKYENWIVANGHVSLAGEPPSVGGTGNGPTPYDLLSASLGACTSMTLRMYADRKAWPIDDILVEVTHAKDHAADCEACVEGQDVKVDIFERTIRVKGALDEEQRGRLLEIADKCPVHKSLHSPVVVRTRLA
ncbi:MAG: bifunctional alpha/beta hydrolase/OsmC family protein [Maricaulis sp.]|uniref:bifunctional alpha/beta hydrolase/OsmC family protein n=1 Tax=Maricaulis sp. TaxID=1486257 RepID=UPI001AFFEF71|nr:bifunctional alpha/beta hydrolase/OsmC family protein [Maricaulis sp.]MBO6730834.1 OsmC family protein [Maricaulis sp.]MBO6848299.1 OsmC family protein [Maricaulis sp.]MBO6878178.1 OsmC family protein [Maricaulis sp.]MDM7983419.1 bifunctional alpha/beta hydrolase/OsmC family protein [Maricaulis sp.]